MTKPIVFISYSHDSDDHREKVLALSERLRADGLDTRLDQYVNGTPPETWPRWMLNQLDDANFVLVICTENYYRRFRGKEVPGKGKGVDWEGALITQELYDARRTTLKFVPILFDADHEPHVPEPLRGLTHYQPLTKQGYDDLYDFLLGQAGVEPGAVGELKRKPRAKGKPLTFEDDATNKQLINVARLPQLLTRDLFGREAELKLLDDAWANPATNVLTFVAWGGVGKTALVNHWVRRLARRNYDGATRVYAWSFYSQGTSDDRAATAEYFINEALAWFGDPDPAAGSSWDKGERLASLIRAQRTLLLLDGLEPLQQPPNELGLIEGRLKEQSMQALLRELAAGQPGLCVISTRVTVTELEDYESAALRYDLNQLAPRAGAQLLRKLGVTGENDELRKAAEEFGGHSLALTLLGGYLSDVCGGDVRRRHEIEAVTADAQHGGHARRVMASYEKWLGNGPELAVLRLLGLFDRPADADSIAALRAAPVIPGLTEKLQCLKESEWQQVLAKLRRVKLISTSSSSVVVNLTDVLDAHPLIREHFRQWLKRELHSAWREANNRLYEHLTRITKEFPDTIEEMSPLYTAVVHACEAGKHAEAWNEIYWKRIQRRNKYYSFRTLGAFSADLAVLSVFFYSPWEKLAIETNSVDRAEIFDCAGFALRALGQLTRAIQPTQAGMQIRILQEDWKNASTGAVNLSEIYLTIGNPRQSLVHAQQAADLANLTGDRHQKMAKKARLANVLHQLGRLQEAGTVFREAEIMQKEVLPEHEFLLSFRGFLYCDLLLGQGMYREVIYRASTTIKWAMAENLLLAIALDNLSLGKAYLLQVQSEDISDYSQAAEFLRISVDGLRRAGQIDDLPRGLLARAELYRLTGHSHYAQSDLAEAFAIAERGEMRLHLADCHLESARLALATGNRDSASKAWETAQKMIEEMGYHRRDGEVKEIKQQLNAE